MTNKKKSNLLKPSTPAQPAQTYTRQNIYSVANSDALPTKVLPEAKSVRGKRTSISCFQDTKLQVRFANKSMTENRLPLII